MKANIVICSREISLIFSTLFTLRYNFVAQMVKNLVTITLIGGPPICKPSACVSQMNRKDELEKTWPDARLTLAVDDITYLTIGVESKRSSDVKCIDHFVSLWSESIVSNFAEKKRSVDLDVWLPFTFTKC